MIAIKIVRTTFDATRNPWCPNYDIKKLRKLSTLSTCRSKSDDAGSDTSPPEGDLQKQELLTRIVQIQAQKFRLTNYLDERSTYLTQFAEEASAEIDAIGENALKDLDEASARIMENIESRMQEFEDSSDISKDEIAKTEKELAEVKGEVENGRNEGLFFQSLGEKPSVDKTKAKDEVKKITDITKKSAGSKTRRNLYLALIGVVALGIADSFITFSGDWQKVALLSAIFVGLITQLVYEQKMLSESEGKDAGKE